MKILKQKKMHSLINDADVVGLPKTSVRPSSKDKFRRVFRGHETRSEVSGSIAGLLADLKKTYISNEFQKLLN